jgi:hypothetical protein
VQLPAETGVIEGIAGENLSRRSSRGVNDKVDNNSCNHPTPGKFTLPG